MTFDTMNVARAIRGKRMEANMTQMQLADALGISYQAVSNWERGNSMPDISKLGELAAVLNCTLEELLGNNEKTRTIQKIITESESEDGDGDGKTADSDKEGKQINMEELVELAPLLPPKQTQSFLDKIVSEQKTVDFKEIVSIAPFLSEEMLDGLVKSAVQEADFDLHELTGLAPFLEDETLDWLVKKVTERSDFDPKILTGLAPFLEDETLDWLVWHVLEKGMSSRVLVPLAPFLPDETLEQLAAEIVKRDGISAITPFAPFL